jgi:hypothetical protein
VARANPHFLSALMPACSFMWRQQELQELEARGFSLKQIESLADHNMRFMYICRAAQQVGRCGLACVVSGKHIHGCTCIALMSTMSLKHTPAHVQVPCTMQCLYAHSCTCICSLVWCYF